MRVSLLAGCIAGLLLASVFLVPVSAAPAAPRPLFTAHSPIRIQGDANFTAANGVTGGAGTAADPYVIQGWDISTATSNGIELDSTSAHVILRNLALHGDYSGYNGVYLGSVSNVTVENITANTSAEGIYVSIGASIVIASNNCSGNQAYGIDVVAATHSRVEGNIASGASYGIRVSGSSYVTVSRNRIDRTQGGLEVFVSSDVTVDHNVVTNGTMGSFGITWALGVHDSNRVSLLGNELSGNGQTGIEFVGSNGGAVVWNNLTGNNVGASMTRSNATMTHNAFLNNTEQAASDSTAPWDAGYPTGGNWWSDYVGADSCSGPAQNVCTGGDGIGDTPYAGLVRDRYPLLLPWQPPRVDFTYRPSGVFQGDIVTFTALPIDPTGIVTSYAWSFGDGSTAVGPVVNHTFTLIGSVPVQLSITDNRGKSATITHVVAIYEPLDLVTFVHAPDFTIPVPSAWSTTKDANLSGETVELLAYGPILNNFRTNLIVNSLADISAEETTSYLSLLVNETMAGLHPAHPDAAIAYPPEFVTVSGHAAVLFTIMYTSLPVAQRAAIVVDAAVQRDWVLIFSAALVGYPYINATFARILPGFTITLGLTSAPGTLGDLLLVVGGLSAAAAASVLLILYLVRRRERHAPGAAEPTCATCGRALNPGARFCGVCGAPVPGGPPPTPVAPPPMEPPRES